MSSAVTIELPWPPSDNRLIRHFTLPGRKAPSTCLSEEARDYYKAVNDLLFSSMLPHITGPLHMHVELYPPTRREIDGANRLKALQDSLKRRELGRRQKGKRPVWDKKQTAWLFARDDSQVVSGGWKLCHVVPGGKAIVTLTKLYDLDMPVDLFSELEGSFYEHPAGGNVPFAAS